MPSHNINAYARWAPVTLTVNPASWPNAPATRSLTTFTITTNYSGNLSAVGLQEWLTASVTGTGSTRTLTITADANPHSEVRNGTVTISISGLPHLNQRIAVTQAARQGGVVITFNPNGGRFIFGQYEFGPTFPIAVEMEPGSLMGANFFPTPYRPRREGMSNFYGFPRYGAYVFAGWFNTPQPTESDHGMRFTNASTVPNSSITLFARWTNPTYHMDYWYQSNSIALGEFRISLNGIGNEAVWEYAMMRGVDNWNNSALTNINVSVASGNRVYAEPIAGGTFAPFGTFTPNNPQYLYPGASVRSFMVMLNVERIIEEAQGNSNSLSNIITSTMTHELGHAIGLTDNHNRYTSIMAPGRNRNGIFTPQNFDIMNVRTIYHTDTWRYRH